MHDPHSSQNIIFFDGVCNLCNHWVDFLIRKDKRNVFLYAPLQSSTADRLLSNKDTTFMSSVIYYTNGKVFYKSDAVLQLLWDLGGLWKASIVLKLIPRFLRNFIYNWVAQNRYRWFGKKETCRLPTVEEREKFLD
jgi:predicted DCC family thiol-disulfide oxidoreductase YuxK